MYLLSRHATRADWLLTWWLNFCYVIRDTAPATFDLFWWIKACSWICWCKSLGRLWWPSEKKELMLRNLVVVSTQHVKIIICLLVCWWHCQCVVIRFVVICRTRECPTESCCWWVSSCVDQLQDVCLGTWWTQTCFTWLDWLHGSWPDYPGLTWYSLYHGSQWR